jgi:hypothetical protein
VLTLNTPQTSLDPLNDQGLAILLTGIGPFTDRIDGTPWQFKPKAPVSPGILMA